jgi:hypothetical protein
MSIHISGGPDSGSTIETGETQASSVGRRGEYFLYINRSAVPMDMRFFSNNSCNSIEETAISRGNVMCQSKFKEADVHHAV